MSSHSGISAPKVGTIAIGAAGDRSTSQAESGPFRCPASSQSKRLVEYPKDGTTSMFASGIPNYTKRFWNKIGTMLYLC
jgi:hypothetical protein